MTQSLPYHRLAAKVASSYWGVYMGISFYNAARIIEHQLISQKPKTFEDAIITVNACQPVYPHPFHVTAMDTVKHEIIEAIEKQSRETIKPNDR